MRFDLRACVCVDNQNDNKALFHGCFSERAGLVMVAVWGWCGILVTVCRPK